MNTTQIDNRPAFAMVQIKDAGRITRLMGERRLHLMDAALVLALISHTHTYSGRILVTVRKLSEELQIRESDARAGIARLIKQNQLRRIKDRDTGEVYFRLNPWMVQSAKGSLLGLAEKEFTAA